MPKTDVTPLEEIFRVRVFTKPKEEGSRRDELVDNLKNGNIQASSSTTPE